MSGFLSHLDHESKPLELREAVPCWECAHEVYEVCALCTQDTCCDCCPKVQRETYEAMQDRLFDEKVALGYL